MASALDVAKAFLQLSDSDAGDVMTNLKLQKLVYYAQGFSLALHNRPLFEERIVAWEHGPVVAELYHEFKTFGKNQVEVDSEIAEGTFTDEQMELLSEVNQVYGQFSAWKLRDMTHNEIPWKQTAQGSEIKHELLKEYFKTQLA